MRTSTIESATFGMALLVSWILLGHASTLYAGKEDRRQPQVTVRIYDYAGLPYASLGKVIEMTNMIMSRAGLEAEIVRCRGDGLRNRKSRCLDLPPSEPLILLIVSKCTGRSSRATAPLGIAVTSGRYAALCAGRVLAVAGNSGLDPNVVTAYAAAHEIGHLLLGPAHGSSGIMRANWEEIDIRAMAKFELSFSKFEREAMRRHAWKNAACGGEYPPHDASRRLLLGP